MSAVKSQDAIDAEHHVETNQITDTVIEVCKLNHESAIAFDDYVVGAEHGTFFHLSAWRVVFEQVFNLETHYLYAKQDGNIVGVYPLALLDSALFGKRLVSTPFCVYGGIVADNAVAANALVDKAQSLARELDVDYLESKQSLTDDVVDPEMADFVEKELYVTFKKTLFEDEESNLQAIPRKQRAMVRKGIKNGLNYQIDDHIEHFWNNYATSVRNLGTPVLPKAYFEAIFEAFGDQCEILTVTKDGKPVSSVMSFYYKDQVLPYYGGGIKAARSLKANDYMYWALMCHSVENRSSRIFDYGRSKIGTGSYSFKKNWGFEPTPMPYRYYLVNSTETPNLNPLNPKYRLFIKAWQHLPLSLSRWIGPWIAKQLG